MDVGANHGSKTEIFRKLADRVVAVEPDPSSAGLLRRRFKWRRSVVVCQCAVTDTPGSKAFYQFEPGSAFNTADSTWAKSMMDGSNHMGIKLGEPKEIRVPARTIADLEMTFRPIKYLKIDVEGHEEKALSTLSRAIPLISLEFNFPQMYGALEACVRNINSLGDYRFNAAISEPPEKFEFSWLTGEQIIEAIKSSGWGYAELYAVQLRPARNQ